MGDVHRILLVEDREADARLFRHHLRHPITVEFVGEPELDHRETLADGLRAVQENEYDVVLLDLGLPETQGLDTLDRFVETDPDPPIVVLTGNTDDRLAVEAIEHGAQDYLLKDQVNGHRLARSLRYAIERNAQERELRRQNERLEEFARVVSHDLRNPLEIATGRLDYARRDHDDEHLREVARAHERMEEIIADVLQLARQGMTIHDPEPVSLARPVANAVETTTLREADVVVEDDLPTVQGDGERLVALFENLLRNAVVHGRADAEVRVGSLPAGGGFYVEDDGPGIPVEDRPKVFESGFTTSSAGTGFGLGIVQRIVEAHGWEIRVTNGRTGGARFEVYTSGRPENVTASV